MSDNLQNEFVTKTYEHMGATNATLMGMDAQLKRLEQIVITGNPSLKEEVRNLAQKFKGLSDEIHKAQEAANKAAAAASTASGAAKKIETVASKWWENRSLQLCAAIVFGAVLVLILGKVINPADFK